MTPESGSAGIRVFLIADIRGYTMFTQEQGDEAAGRLAQEFAVIARERTKERGGELVELRGDEALVSFQSARGAITAAVELQSSFVDRAIEVPELPLYVGIGLDVGEAVAVEDGFRGGALNLASRLCSMAAPGEILASREVVHLARFIEDIEYAPRGETKVKGLPDPVPVYRIVPASDPAERISQATSGTKKRMKVTIADDSVLLREGIVRLLVDSGFDVIAQAGDAEELLAAVRVAQPDVAIVDVRMPPTHTDEGLRAARVIRDKFPDVGVLVLSQYVETDYAMELVSDGAARLGYMLKDRVSNLQEFTDAVQRVGKGGSVIDPEVVTRLVGRARQTNPLDALTERERSVLELMAEGRSNRAIAERLSPSEKTVEGHVRNIFNNFGLEQAPDDHRRVLAVLTFLRS